MERISVRATERDKVEEILVEAVRDYASRLLRETLLEIDMEKFAELAKSKTYGLRDPALLPVLRGVAIGIATFGCPKITQDDLRNLEMLLKDGK